MGATCAAGKGGLQIEAFTGTSILRQAFLTAPFTFAGEFTVQFWLSATSEYASISPITLFRMGTPQLFSKTASVSGFSGLSITQTIATAVVTRYGVQLKTDVVYSADGSSITSAGVCIQSQTN